MCSHSFSYVSWIFYDYYIGIFFSNINCMVWFIWKYVWIIILIFIIYIFFYSAISFCFSTSKRNAMEYCIINMSTNLCRSYTLFVCTRSFSSIFSFQTCMLKICFIITMKFVFIFRKHSGIWCSIVINNQKLNCERSILL